MALTKRIFYTLPELAMRWRKSEDDLIHMAAAGGLPLSIIYEGHVSGLPVWSCQGFLSLYPHDAAKFLLGNKPEVEISRFYDPDCDPNSPRKHLFPITLPENYEDLEEAVQSAVPTKLKITRADLVIMARAVIRLEAEQPELLAQGTPVVSTASKEAESAFPDVETDLADKKGGSPKGGLHNEIPLMGRKGIANYLGVSESTVKNYMKDRTFPHFSQGGLKCAMPSELDAWRNRKKNCPRARARIL